MCDKVEFLMAIATTVVLEGKNKNTKKLKLTLQLELVGGTSLVKSLPL